MTDDRRVTDDRPEPGDRPVSDDRPLIDVVDPGMLTLVEDLGRPGYASIGVGRSGAADRGALRLGNRLVGNAATAAGLEVVLGGLELVFRRTGAVALTGAAGPAWVEDPDGTTVDVPMRAAVRVPAGAVLRLGPATRGLRRYVAVRGGVDVPVVLGSRSSDLLTGLGPAALAAGDALPVGTLVDGLPELDPAPDRAAPHVVGEPLVLAVLPGPRADWFVPAAWSVLTGRTYVVTPSSNRTALRLDGATLDRAVPGELASEGLVAGALQVPPDGRPVLFLADHPVTGGYPVLAVVTSRGLDEAAQLRPGDTVRFTSAERHARHAG